MSIEEFGERREVSSSRLYVCERRQRDEAQGGPAGYPHALSRLVRGHAPVVTCSLAAAALRSRGLAVLRFPRTRRPSIIGRDGFFVRYGDRERAAVATFDFLDDISPTETKDC